MKKTASRITTTIILLILTASSLWMLPLANAVEPPVVSGGGEYYADYGVLDSDTYILYPWEEKSLQVGFSKYGEIINADMGLGLRYDGVDAFANPMVPIPYWCSGWVMDIHYTKGGYLKNTWAYALFSDRTVEGVDGPWQNLQLTKDASDPSDTNGGRRTNGYAESDPIRLIYDGPRESIYLLKTRIYDKEASQEGTCLVELTIQLVFNKVEKYVMEIKDVKRCDDNKMTGPFQIEFSQRAEWDLGMSSAPRTYAEFYDNLTTSYDKHPFYYPEGDVPANFDLCQIISAPNDPNADKYVGFAAYWPPLISKWVTETENVRRLSDNIDVPSLLSTMETYEYVAQLPTSADDLVDPKIYYDEVSGEIWILLPREPVAYPRGLGEWEEAPWLFKKDATGYAKLLLGSAWDYDETIGPYGGLRIHPFQWTWGDEFKIVYKRFMKGNTPHEPTALECMEPLIEPGEVVTSYGMNEEPNTPYVIGEWDFDLDMDAPENSTQQFRCMSVYGITDYNNAVDPNMGGNTFRIDEEVLYQLNEVFNPVDLKDIAHKDTFSWCQKGTATTTILLEAHLYDKYGNPRDCLEKHIVIFPEKWGYYCEDSEKVLLMDSSGVNPAKLLIRDEDYTVDTDTIVIEPAVLSGYDRYKVLYCTEKLQLTGPWYEDEFYASDYAFDVELSKSCDEDSVTWIIQLGDLGPAHTSTGVQVVVGTEIEPLFTLGWSPGESTTDPVYKPYSGGWGAATTTLPPGMMVSGNYNEDYYEITVPKMYLGGDCFYWAVNTEATSPGYFPDSSSHQMNFPSDWVRWTATNMVEDCCLPWDNGRWEWTVLGESSLPSDSLGAAMLSSAWCDWKNVEVWLSGLDIQATEVAPSIPWVMRSFAETELGREAYYMSPPDDLRASFRDDWCTPDDWMGETVYPYAISSSNIIVVGGPIANLASEYFNDFTAAKVFTEYGDGFYATGCWARTVLDHYQGHDLVDVPDNELWYNSVTTDDDVGHSIISVYKDLNGTTGFIVYGYTAEDTYYTCYALRGGLLDWMQYVQDGTTTLLLEIDYSDLHPVRFHVTESLGLFTECTGFGTNFKTSDYYRNLSNAEDTVEQNAMSLGICYKLVDIEWCAQVHPDP